MFVVDADKQDYSFEAAKEPEVDAEHHMASAQTNVSEY